MRGLIVLVALAVVAPLSSAAAATKSTQVDVPLPANGRQTFAVVKLGLKQDARPARLKGVKLKNPSAVPGDVRTGVATSGPRKVGKGRWEYVMLVAINDLGGARSAAEKPDALELLVTAASIVSPKYALSSCSVELLQQKERLKDLVYANTNIAESSDKQVMQNTVTDAKSNPKCTRS